MISSLSNSGQGLEPQHIPGSDLKYASAGAEESGCYANGRDLAGIPGRLSG
jgi:hypothetical protein